MPKVFADFNDELIELINNGAVGVLPTDTLYGLVAKASNPQAVAKLYSLKNREQKPGTVIAANIEQLEELGIKHRYLKAVEQFWPNPISILIPTGTDLSNLHLGLQSLAVRIPKDQKIQALLKNTGPLITSSANLPGEKPADTIDEAKKYFGDKVDFYVDGGSLQGALGSTIIRVIDDAIEVIRQGAVKINEAGEIE